MWLPKIVYRIRRIKCDEGKPSCLRCKSTGRVCDGYLGSGASRKEICRVLHRDTNLNALFAPVDCFDNDNERRSFDYFRSVTMPKSARFFGSDFWGRRVLQISHCEPAIKYAVLALSSLHQELELKSPSRSGEQAEFAIHSYNKAIDHTSKLLSKTGKNNFEKGLVACALFTCFENLSGGYGAAQMHLQNGLRILSESQDSLAKDRRKPDHTIPNDILQVFSRLDLQAMSFSDSRFPYPFPNLKSRAFEPDPIPSSFSSIFEAQDHFFQLMKWVLFHSENYPHCPTADLYDAEKVANIMSIKCKTDNLLATWDTAFGTFLDQLERNGRWNQEVLHASVILHIYRAMITLVSNANFIQSEVSYDNHYPLFERVLTMVECLPEVSKAPAGDCHPATQKTFSLELGIVMPLFLTAAKCRDPFLRRRAIMHLKTINLQEGVWDSFGAANVVEALMSIEEEGLGDVQSAEDIPEEKRIIETNIVVHIERREVELSFNLRPDPDGPLVAREEVVQF